LEGGAPGGAAINEFAADWAIAPGSVRQIDKTDNAADTIRTRIGEQFRK
jgi:hypothetical protein